MREQIKEAGLRIKDVANELGIHKNTLHEKLSRKSHTNKNGYEVISKLNQNEIKVIERMIKNSSIELNYFHKLNNLANTFSKSNNKRPLLYVNGFTEIEVAKLTL